MKKLVTILAVSIICVSAQAQTIPNAGFENWVTNNESPQHYLVPQNWLPEDVVVNSYVSSYTLSLVTRTTQSNTGQYAILLNTVLDATDTASGMLFSCNSLANYGYGYPYGNYGFTCNTRPAALQGYYKLTSVGGDLGMIQLSLSKWNTTTNSRDMLFQNYYFGLTGASSYTQFNFPITYSLNEYPDTASIMITTAYTSSHAHTGTQLFVDDLSFTGNVPLGIEQYMDTDLTLYPNPAQNNFIIKTNNTDKQNIFVFDVNGKQVLAQTISGTTNIDVSNFNAGIYNVSITTSNAVANKRLVIVK